MINKKKETIDKFKHDFSREIFNKANKSFLKKNLIIPLNIKDECLYVITSKNSNSDEIDSLKLVYPVKSVAVINVEKNDFEKIFNYCFEPLDNNKAQKNKQATKLNGSSFKESEKVSVEHRNKFIQFIKTHRIISGSIAVLILFFCIGLISEYYMKSSFENKLQYFQDNLSMKDKKSFEQSLKNLMDIIVIAQQRVSRYGYLHNNIIWFHVTGVIDTTQKFIELIEKMSNGESLLYDYDCKHTIDILNKNISITLYSIKNNDARELLLSQVLLVSSLRGWGIPKLSCTKSMAIRYPKIVSEEQEERLKRRKQEIQQAAKRDKMVDSLTIRVLQKKCNHGDKLACEALRDLQQGNNKARSAPFIKYRMWQNWAQSMRQLVKEIHPGDTMVIPTLNGSSAQITPETVDQVIEANRPEVPQ